MRRRAFRGRPDEQLWPVVQAAGRFLITKDLDFADERRYGPGSHAGVMVLRMSDDHSRAVAERLALVLSAAEANDWIGCLVVVTDHKVRVRRHTSTKS